MYTFKNSIETIDDLDKLRTPELNYDKKTTLKSLEKHKEYLGDTLPIKLKGYTIVSFHMMHMYSSFRGLNQMYFDFYDSPDLVHEFMEKFTNGYIEMVHDALAQGLLELNNDGSYQSSGG